MTALGGFIIAYVVGLALVYGGTVMLILLTVLAGYMLVHSNFIKKTKSAETTDRRHERKRRRRDRHGGQLDDQHRHPHLRPHAAGRLQGEPQGVARPQPRIVGTLRADARTQIPHDVDAADAARERSRHGAVLRAVVDYLNELTKALTIIVRPAYGHIDNNHEGLTREQTTDLIRVGDEVEAIYRRINAMLTTNDFGDIDLVLSMRDRLFETISGRDQERTAAVQHLRQGEYESQYALPDDPQRDAHDGAPAAQPVEGTRHFLETKAS